MSTKNPTVAELVAAAQQILPALTDEQARNFIRANNIRSNGKLATLVGELAAEHAQRAEPAAPAAPAAPAKSSKPKAEAEEKPTKKFARQGRTKRTTAIAEGPRGFRFGPVWTASVQAGEGVALLDVNKNKLLKHAESLGITSFTAADESAKIAKAIAAAL